MPARRIYEYAVIVTALVAAITPLAYAQAKQEEQAPAGPKVYLEADHVEIKAGQTVTITLRAEYPEGYAIAGALAESYPGVEGFDEQGVHITSYNKDMSLTSESTAQTYTAPKEGNYTIDPVSVTFIDPDGKRVDAKSNGLTIVVLAENAPDEGLRNIKGLKPIRKPLNWLLISTIGAVVFALILIVVLASGRRKRPLAPRAAPSRYASPEDEFIDMLLKLNVPDEFDALAVKRLYIQMSDCIRSYLSAGWDIGARKETTVEVLEELMRAGFPVEALDNYKVMAKAFDMVKYAKSRPFKEDIDAARDAAISFIRFMGGLRR
jgi:hypothetical protein